METVTLIFEYTHPTPEDVKQAWVEELAKICVSELQPGGTEETLAAVTAVLDRHTARSTYREVFAVAGGDDG